MKKYLYILLLTSLSSQAQNLALKIEGFNNVETKKIDSIGYASKHTNAKSILNEVATFKNVLSKMGYLEAQSEVQTKVVDSVFNYKFNLWQQIKFIHIYVSKKQQELLNLQKETVVLPFAENEAFIRNILSKLESKGFSMAKVNLEKINSKQKYLTANLKIETNIQRKLNDIVINGYEKFPAGHLKNLKRLYKNKLFTNQVLEQLQKQVSQFRFVRQLKYPEILFTTDSTKIFLYVEKAKNNTFDGFLGFTNNEKRKLVFSGYIDLVLNNILNSGEKLAINWRSNGTEQTTFNAAIEVPYVFKSPIAVKASLNIIKQDSTFQTTQTAIDFGYYFNYNTRLYLGYQSSESSDIKNLNTALISDFTNEFVTSNFEYVNYKDDSFLFPEKSTINLKIGAGKRASKFEDNSQLFANLFLKHDFYLNPKNCISLKSQHFYLQSPSYIINELYRFGGINSIRGFNENSLQASYFSSILTEYRYIVTSNLYVHTVFDYAVYKDKTNSASDKLLGLGFGFGLLTKNGLFNLVYANGSAQNQQIQLSNSIVQISLKARF